EPIVREGEDGPGYISIVADDRTAEPLRNLPFEYRLGARHLYADAGGQSLFTDNENNAERIYGTRNRRPYVKDAFHRHAIGGEDCVNPDGVGTKACLHYRHVVPGQGHLVLRMRLTPDRLESPLADVDAIADRRKAEADEFYAAIQPAGATADEKL